MTYKQWCLDNLGYETKTTYFEDFSIAERFGINAIKDTFKRSMKNTNYKMMTELCMVLNHKIWFLYESKPQVAQVYDELWRQCCEWCNNNLTGDELKYYYQITD